MQIVKVNSYSPKFEGISSWKREKLRAKAKEAQEEYIRKHRLVKISPLKDERVRAKAAAAHDEYIRKKSQSSRTKPKHPDPCEMGWEDDLRACRKYANSLKRPDPSLTDYYDRLADWKEYSKYRTEK